MKNTDINNVQFADNEVVALLWGDNLVYRKVPRILAGSFTEAGDYTFKYNNKYHNFQLNDDLTFSQNLTEKLLSCNSMFAGNNKLKTITEFPNTKDVTMMQSMFSSCSNLISIDLSNFNTAKVETMGYMFNGCSSLQSLDLSGFVTDKVFSMVEMFNGCSSLQELIISNFNTENVSQMQRMFYGCTGLTSLDLSSFDTSNVTNMNSMFGLLKMSQIDLSSFDTSNVTNMNSMFRSSSFTSLDLSSFDTSNVTDMSYMFGTCVKLINLDLGSNFNMSNVSDQTNMLYSSAYMSLTNVTGTITGIHLDIDLRKCSKLTHSSTLVFLNGLAEVSETKSITLHQTTYNLLSDEEIALATSRGWSVVSA